MVARGEKQHGVPCLEHHCAWLTLEPPQLGTGRKFTDASKYVDARIWMQEADWLQKNKTVELFFGCAVKHKIGGRHFHSRWDRPWYSWVAFQVAPHWLREAGIENTGSQGKCSPEVRTTLSGGGFTHPGSQIYSQRFQAVNSLKPGNCLISLKWQTLLKINVWTPRIPNKFITIRTLTVCLWWLEN